MNSSLSVLEAQTAPLTRAGVRRRLYEANTSLATRTDRPPFSLHWTIGSVLPQTQSNCRYTSRTMSDPADVLLRISMSHGVPRCLHAVAELGVADALGESPRTAGELAKETGTDAGALARTLRVLSAEGIFEARDGAWGHTPKGGTGYGVATLLTLAEGYAG